MNTCKECQHYRDTKDGPYCFNGRIRPVSPIQTKDCFTPITEKPEVATKVCKHCGRELPVDNFGRHPVTKDGYQPVCKECRSKEMKGKPRPVKTPKPERQPETPKAPKTETPKDILAQFTDDQLIEEIRRRGWGGRLSITHNYML